MSYNPADYNDLDDLDNLYEQEYREKQKEEKRQLLKEAKKRKKELSPIQDVKKIRPDSPEELEVEDEDRDLSPNEDQIHGADDEAEEAPEKRKITARKLVLNPRPKLDADRLKTEKGLIALKGLKLDLKGKGHEVQDLDRVMFCMEHWAHRLFPKLNFADFLEKVETLGSKKVMGTFIRKMRMKMPLDIRGLKVDDDNEIDPEFDEEIIEEQNAETAETAFDRLFRNEIKTKCDVQRDLTEDERQMIARKRLEAIERRKLYMSQTNENMSETRGPVDNAPLPSANESSEQFDDDFDDDLIASVKIPQKDESDNTHERSPRVTGASDSDSEDDIITSKRLSKAIVISDEDEDAEESPADILTKNLAEEKDSAEKMLTQEELIRLMDQDTDHEDSDG